MRFLTKDLMITVLPRAGVSGADLPEKCYWQTRICMAPTYCQGETYEAAMTCRCPHNTWGTGSITQEQAFVINDREDLIALRTELQETIDQLKKIQKTIPSGVKSEADAKKLAAALTEVSEQAMKSATELKK